MSAYSYATDFFLPPHEHPPQIHGFPARHPQSLQHAAAHQPPGQQPLHAPLPLHSHDLNAEAQGGGRLANSHEMLFHPNAPTYYATSLSGNSAAYPPPPAGGSHSQLVDQHALPQGFHFYHPTAPAPWTGVPDGAGAHFDVNYVNAAAPFDYGDLSSGGIKSWPPVDAFSSAAAQSAAQLAAPPPTVASAAAAAASLLNADANEMLLLNCGPPASTAAFLSSQAPPPPPPPSIPTSTAMVAAAAMLNGAISTSIGGEPPNLRPRAPAAAIRNGGRKLSAHLRAPSALHSAAHQPNGQRVANPPAKLFSCNQCGRQYCRKSTLKAHMKQHMGADRQFACPTCGKTFTQAANLTAHRRVHTGEKPFACSICLRPFSQSSSLVTHRRTHSGERPYPCSHCSKSFTDSSTLTKHLRTHSGIKPYSCNLCLMRFSQSGNLHRHLKTHRAFGNATAGGATLNVALE